ncbi:hypothetical protein B0O99DRAFT_505825 [Bisporella sp. PMI_857]|nr:hypothetical protein B0O99DRAFT_505825 [Bisporella sp. PMI_857]
MAIRKRIGVIGAGPAGAIAVDCLAQEHAFSIIRIFERREKAGGCWVQDPPTRIPEASDFTGLANRTADLPRPIPKDIPTYTRKSSQNRYAETSVYPYLEANIDSKVMEFSQEPIQETKSELSIKRHGPQTPFRHHSTIQKYVQSLLERESYQDMVEYNTTVERVEKIPERDVWRLTLRKEGPSGGWDYWWVEEFDAVLVANGHYTVPYIPYIDGLEDFAKAYPGSVEHSKAFRGVEKYKNKRVVVVGASVSGMDIATDLIGVARSPVHCVVRGRWHPYFGGSAFEHPLITKHPAVKYIESGNRTVFLEDGTSINEVDNIILGTGYSWTLPFLPDVPIRNNRVPDLYLHVFKRDDPTLIFIGAVAAGLTFKVYEWQSVLAARYLADRIELPSVEEQERWERDRVSYKGDGVPFTALYPDFEDYFETVRMLAGEPTAERPGRRLPKFDKGWVEKFQAGHRKRIDIWEKGNEITRAKLKTACHPQSRL